MSFLEFNEGAAPSTPTSGKGTLYLSTAGDLHLVNDSGSDLNLINNDKTNLVRNSGLWLAQRQSTVGSATYSSVGGRAVTADGWGVSNENASVTYTRTDTAAAPETNLNARFYGTFTKITVNGKLVICQVIEDVDIAPVRNSTVRVQLWAKVITANATWRIGLVQLTAAGTVDTVPSGAGLFCTAFGAGTVDPTLGANLAYIAPTATITPDNATTSGSAASMAVTSDWQRFGACFDVPVTAKNLVLMIWSDSQVAANDGINVSQLSLTIGDEVQAWAPQSIQAESARCFRYYQKSFNIDVAPVQSAGLQGGNRGAVSVAGITAGQPLGVRLYPPMRAAPGLITMFNPSAANAFVRNTTAGTDATATASANASEDGFDVTFTGIAAWAVAQGLSVHWTADAEL